MAPDVRWRLLALLASLSPRNSAAGRDEPHSSIGSDHLCLQRALMAPFAVGIH